MPVGLSQLCLQISALGIPHENPRQHAMQVWERRCLGISGSGRDRVICAARSLACWVAETVGVCDGGQCTLFFPVPVTCVLLSRDAQHTRTRRVCLLYFIASVRNLGTRCSGSHGFDRVRSVFLLTRSATDGWSPALAVEGRNVGAPDDDQAVHDRVVRVLLSVFPADGTKQYYDSPGMRTDRAHAARREYT